MTTAPADTSSAVAADAAPALPVLVEQVEVTAVHRLSPSFVRLELGSPALADLDDGPALDQRIKLVFPHPGRPLFSTEGFDASWYESWCALPAEDRGSMRTYTLRGRVGEGPDTRMLVDFVLHGEGDGHGPGGDFAADVRVGQRVVAIAPRRGHEYGGIEFLPGDARHLLLVGDETAVPAVAGILEALPADARGAVFVEVPVTGDVVPLEAPPGIEITWSPRDGGPRGTALHAAVLDHLGRPDALGLAESVADDEVDPDLWETPAYSASGEATGRDDQETLAGPSTWEGCYFWIAGESKVVTGLRRALVKELGVDRRQVAFMGYWREGVAMKG